MKYFFIISFDHDIQTDFFARSAASLLTAEQIHNAGSEGGNKKNPVDHGTRDSPSIAVVRRATFDFTFVVRIVAYWNV